MTYINHSSPYVVDFHPVGYQSQQNGTGSYDLINGGHYADNLYGNYGHDTLIGKAGDDVLRGGQGVDYMNGGMDNDVYFYTLADITSSSNDFVRMDGNSYVQADNINMPTGDFSLNIQFRMDEDASGTLFSYAMPGHYNEITFTIQNGAIVTRIDENFSYTGTKISSLEWHDFTLTYDQSSGDITVYDFGKEILTQKVTAGTHAESGGMLIIGQEQDTYGGGFSDSEALAGEVASVTIWDKELSQNEVANPNAATSIHNYDFSVQAGGAVVDTQGDDNLTIMNAPAQGGVDQIYDRHGFDVIRFDQGVNASDITAQVSITNPLNIDLYYQGDVFSTVQSQFASFDTGVDLLQFYDGTEVAISDLVENPREALPETQVSADNAYGHNWGGADVNMFRGGSYSGRDGHDGFSAADTIILNIATGTDTADIQSAINSAALDQHLIVRFAAGEHEFTDELVIARGNITVEGAGDGLTTFVTDGIDNTLAVRGPDNSAAGQWKNYLSDYIGNAAQEFNYGDDSITLTDTDGLAAGDYIMIVNSVNSYGADVAQTSMAQIQDIVGNDLVLEHKLAFDSADRPSNEQLGDIKVYKTDFLENVTLQDFSIRYDNVDLDADYDRYSLNNQNSPYAQNDPSSGAELNWGQAYSVLVAGTHEAHVSNITIENTGSIGFKFYSNLETVGDNLAVLDTYNRGDGGNGYGVEYYQSYYNDFNNLEFGLLRHGLTAQKDGSSAFNNFHIEYAESNADFHGGDDRGNIYYIENMVAQPFTRVGQESQGGISTNLIDNRHGNNEEYNHVIFDRATALDMQLAGDTFINKYIGHEALYASDNGAFINAGVGNDKLVSGAGNDTLVGGMGADTFSFLAQNGIDDILDFEMNDTLSFTLNSALGWDAQSILDAATQNGGDVVISLSHGHEVRLAYTNIEDISVDQIEVYELAAGAFDPVFYGSSNADYFDGSLGVFTVDYTESAQAIYVDLQNNNIKNGDAQGDVLISIENIMGSDDAGARDYIWGDDGANIINGQAGNDILEGGGGADIIDGGEGWDYARYTRSDDGVSVNLETGVNTGGDAQGDVISGVEAIIGSSYMDTIIGDAGNNFIRGEHGDDVLGGGAGADLLFGGEGDDTFIYTSGRDRMFEQGDGIERVVFDTQWTADMVAISGNNLIFQSNVNQIAFNNIDLIEYFKFDGLDEMTLSELIEYNSLEVDGNTGTTGDDVFIGTSDMEIFDGLGGSDTVDYSLSSQGLRLDLQYEIATKGDAAGDSYLSIENIIAADDAATRDWVWGDAGDNAIYGMTGNDILEGGAGADIIDGGVGWDYARYTRSDEGVNINLETGVNTGGHAQGDVISGVEAIVGSAHNDVIHGGDSNDYIRGENGDDILSGGAGADHLYGGNGADSFLFEAVSAFGRSDHVRDFNVLQGDSLNVADLLEGYDPVSEAIADFVQITDNGTDSFLAVDADGGGDNFVKIATLYGQTGLTDEDGLVDTGHLIV